MEKIYLLLCEINNQEIQISFGNLQETDKFTMNFYDENELINYIKTAHKEINENLNYKIVLRPLNNKSENKKVMYKKHEIIFEEIIQEEKFITHLIENDVDEKQKITKVINNIIDNINYLNQIEEKNEIIRNIILEYKKCHKKLNLPSSTEIIKKHEQNENIEGQLDLFTGKPYTKK